MRKFQQNVLWIVKLVLGKKTVSASVIGIALIIAAGGNSFAGQFREVQLLPEESVASDEFGASVSICGDYALIGAPGKDSNKGRAYIFKRNGSQWNLQATLGASDGAYGDRFGISVFLSSTHAVIGAISHNHGSSVKSGSAFIFTAPPDGWNGDITESAELISSDRAYDDRFGWSVGIYEDNVIVGAPYKDIITEKDDRGAAYVFTKPAAGWNGIINESAKLKPSGDRSVSQFYGFSVSLSKNYAIVGARGLATTQSFGAAFIYKKSESGWADAVETSALRTGVAGDMFGDACVIHDTYALIGAYSDDRYGKNKGSAYLYKRIEENWSKEIELTASDAADSDDFSREAVAMTGDMIVIGANGVDKESADGVGAFYVFKRLNGVWVEVKKVFAGSGLKYDAFGSSIAVWGNYIISGAPKFDLEGRSASGTAYIYNMAIPGDLDFSGTNDLNDVIIALKVLAGSSNTVELRPDFASSGADINGDNMVGMEEVIYNLQIIYEMRKDS